MKKHKTKKALGLHYDNTLPAPIIVAKGKGFVADKIISIAKTEDIPIIKDESTAAILEPLDLGDFVPEEYWEIVASILIFVRKMKQ